LLCEDLAQNVSRLFKDGGISLATISVNVRPKGSSDDVRAHHFVIDGHGTMRPVHNPRARKGDLKKACTLLGLDTACELDDYLPADLAVITPASQITFEEWWDLRSCSIEALSGSTESESNETFGDVCGSLPRWCFASMRSSKMSHHSA
jgi:hypothetical protein